MLRARLALPRDLPVAECVLQCRFQLGAAVCARNVPGQQPNRTHYFTIEEYLFRYLHPLAYGLKWFHRRFQVSRHAREGA